MYNKTYTARDGTPYTCYYNSKGELHNYDGPAVVFYDYVEYWIHGVLLTEAEFNSINKITLDYSSAVVDNDESVTF